MTRKYRKSHTVCIKIALQECHDHYTRKKFLPTGKFHKSKEVFQLMIHYPWFLKFIPCLIDI